MRDGIRLFNLDIKDGPSVLESARALEALGYRFCVDFGTENARTVLQRALIAAPTPKRVM